MRPNTFWSLAYNEYWHFWGSISPASPPGSTELRWGRGAFEVSDTCKLWLWGRALVSYLWPIVFSSRGFYSPGSRPAAPGRPKAQCWPPSLPLTFLAGVAPCPLGAPGSPNCALWQPRTFLASQALGQSEWFLRPESCSASSNLPLSYCSPGLGCLGLQGGPGERGASPRWRHSLLLRWLCCHHTILVKIDFSVTDADRTGWPLHMHTHKTRTSLFLGIFYSLHQKGIPSGWEI